MKIITTVHRPELTDKERERRMAAIKEAATRLIVAAEINKARRA